MSAMSLVDVNSSPLSFSLRYPPRLGCCTNTPPPWTCVCLPTHGQPWPFCTPPVLPAADHVGLPFWSRSVPSKLSERGLKCSIITLSISFNPAFKKTSLKQPPCPLVIAVLYLVLNIMLCTTKPAFSWQLCSIVLWPEILCSQEIGFLLKQCEPNGPLATQ